MTEDIILVDDQDRAIGTMEKMEAHRKGMLHRAFSVLIFNSQGEMLLQKRSRQKYHSGGLWTNACCSHPAPNEPMLDAIRRRIIYEMGIDVNPSFAFKFIYKAKLDHDLIEHEFDHVYTAAFDGVPAVNTDEVESWKFISLAKLREELKRSPDLYTVWFKLILDHPDYLVDVSKT